MKSIPLTGRHGAGKFAIVDDSDYDSLIQWRWKLSGHGYAERSTYVKGRKNRVLLRMHRYIMDAAPGQEVDHIDRNKLNNCRSNLRFCTHKENCQNASKRKNAASKYKGVTRFTCKGSSGNLHAYWRAQIFIDGKRKYVGFSKSEDEAALFYNRAALKYYGEFANLNEIKKSEE